MLCKKCNQPLTNTNLIGGCKYNTKLITSRHNNTFKLLRGLLETHNIGRWPILSMDLERKPASDFTTQTHITPQEDHSLQPLETTQQGLQNDKGNANHPTIIPIALLPKHRKPTQHKPEIIRAIRYTTHSHGSLVEDTTYRGRKCLQIV